MKKMILFIIVIAIIILACGTTPAVQPTLVRQAAVQITPFERALLNASFYEDGYECSTSCNSYTYDGENIYVSSLVYPGGSVSMSFPLGEEWDAGEEGRIMGTVLIDSYGIDVLQWFTEHLPAAVYQDQTGTVDGHYLSVVVKFLDSGEAMLIIDIQP